MVLIGSTVWAKAPQSRCTQIVQKWVDFWNGHDVATAFDVFTELTRGCGGRHRSLDSSLRAPAAGTVSRSTTRAWWAVRTRRRVLPAILLAVARRWLALGGRPPHITGRGNTRRGGGRVPRCPLRRHGGSLAAR